MKKSFEVLKQMYSDSYHAYKVKEKTVLYEAFGGRGMLCNPHGVFQAFMQRDDFDQYEHYWSISDFEDNQETIKAYESYPNVFFVEFESEEYMKALCQCQILINNSPFQTYFSKRPEQIYINTWHGTPLKTMGFDMPDGNVSAANAVRAFLQADYLMSPSSFQTEMYTRAYKMEGIFEGKIVECGQVRNDFLKSTDRQELLTTLEKHGVDVDHNKKIILYAPTWKGTDFSNPEVGVDEYRSFLTFMDENMDGNEYQVLVKPHQIVYKFLKDQGAMDSRMIPATIDTNQLLSQVDILISDYSSIYFDFLKTGRPILFYIPDVEAYKDYRNMYFTLEQLPGPYTKSIQELAQWIGDIDKVQSQYKKIYKTTAKWACGHDKGNSGAKLLQAVLDGKKWGIKTIEPRSKKKKLLICRGGMADGEVTEGLIHLLDMIDYKKYDVTVYVAAPKNESNFHNIFRMNKNARVITRLGSLMMTEDEERALEEYVQTGNENVLPKEVFDAEYSRCFGQAKFDLVMDFNGKNWLFAGVLANSSAPEKFIWQHDVMDPKEDKRVICFYKDFHKIVVSHKTLLKENKTILDEIEPSNPVVYLKNMTGYQAMVEKAKDNPTAMIDGKEYYIKRKRRFNPMSATLKTELVQRPDESMTNFVTIDVSPKLINPLVKQFKKFADQKDNVRLYILGNKEEEGTVRWVREASLVGDKVIHVQPLESTVEFLGDCDCYINAGKGIEGQEEWLAVVQSIDLPILTFQEKTKAKVFEKYFSGDVMKAELSAEDRDKEAYAQYEELIGKVI